MQQQILDNNRTITCPNNHLLLQTADLDPYIATDYLTAQYTCNSCRIQFSRDSSSHFCVLCKFDLCQDCYELQPKVRISCPQGHILFRTNSANMIKMYKSWDSCGNCKKRFDSNDLPTSCFKCRYDLCTSCSSNYGARISQLNNLLKHNPAEGKPNYPMGTCEKFHPLVLIEEPAPRGFGSMIISLLKTQLSYTCLACGFKFDNESKEVSLYSCKACKFDLCSGCCQLTRAINFRCPKEHKLYLVSSLKQFDRSFMSGSNMYKCSCCGKEYDSEISPSCHCKTCRFDICLQCCASYQLLRNQKEQKIEQVVSMLKKKDDPAVYEDQKEKSYEELKEKANPDEKLKEKQNFTDKVKEKEGYIDEFKEEKIPVEKLKEKENFEDKVKEEERKELKEEMTCIVCLNSARTHLFTPCGHLCVCEGCSVDVIKKKTGCPICRVEIQGAIKVFLS